MQIFSTECNARIWWHTIAEKLHNSAFHREGFDPNCPKCLKDEDIAGIIRHLAEAAAQNERDGALDSRAVAAEQRRMIRVLKLYDKVMEVQNAR